ncbi:2OG-Fe(II)oxygenase superfamily [Fusarium napiforme]|uniref:2OG-Fe(II)oxygenase superfamily n=1 Tax=Fusarium napiforme TaxID=42672 RepID=A0A8H5IYA9_9HYPO|nr:2OG-Fe(II)oxygenase superfamily [Fusarium napiforme]
MSLRGGQHAVRLPQQHAVGLGEERVGAGGTQDAHESHRNGAEGHKEQLRQELIPGAARESDEVRLAEDTGDGTSDVRADDEDQHPPGAAPLGLLNAGDSDDGGSDAAGDDGEGNLVFLRRHPDERQTQRPEDDGGGEVSRIHLPVGKRRVKVPERKQQRSEERPGPLASLPDLRRVPDGQGHDALHEREQHANAGKADAGTDKDAGHAKGYTGIRGESHGPWRCQGVFLLMIPIAKSLAGTTPSSGEREGSGSAGSILHRHADARQSSLGSNGDWAQGESCRVRLITYPASSTPAHDGAAGEIRAGERTDYGSLALLYREPSDKRYLQADQNGSWKDVPCFGATIVLNIGDALEFWMAERLRSTVHYVALTLEQEAKT